ncbi:MAG: non-canonical purine NTP pyrophosphatase, partial [Candidatus Heimdallarchaeota archaeon]|nr:non-canonical purine NTP pyrophosphatase [Candidatus Heimdallarchaeota archaeon]
EDTGFFIHELKNFPGPYAAFIEKTIGNPGIHRLMAKVAQRSAEFRTAIAFIQPGFPGHVVEAKVTGKITETIRQGTSGEGWGYDPIFIPDNHNQTYAEMGREQKNRCSHRYNAFKLFANWYKIQFLKSEKESNYSSK